MQTSFFNSSSFFIYDSKKYTLFEKISNFLKSEPNNCLFHIDTLSSIDNLNWTKLLMEV